MDWLLDLALYFTFWWVALFIVLPIRLDKAKEDDPYHKAHGAPQKPRMGWRLMLTTLVGTIIWGVVYGSVSLWGWEGIGSLFPVFVP